MAFFDQDVKSLSPWQLPWAVAWPNDEWHRKMLENGLVPVLGGIDIKATTHEEGTLEKIAQNEGFRLVLGLVRQTGEAPSAVDDNALEELLQSLRRDGDNPPKWDEKLSEISIPSFPPMRMYIGLHKNKLWPERLEDPSAFIKTIDEISDTSLVYYSDAEQKFHVCSTEDEKLDVYEDGGFTALFPEGLRGHKHSAWSVLKAA